MAWHMSSRSLEKPGSMTGFLTKAKRWPMNSPNVLEEVLRRDREVVALVLVTVIIASWLYLLAGAGTGMYPHKMAVFVPAQMSMEPSMPGTASMSGHETMTGASGKRHGGHVDVTGQMDARLCASHVFDVVAHDDCNDATERSAYGAIARCGYAKGTCTC
jgi:hypothetical protein